MPLLPIEFNQLKLFAHIHNDATISGSSLEGLEFKVTIQYMSEFLNKISEGKIRIPGLTGEIHQKFKTKFDALNRYFKDCIRFEHEINTAISELQKDSIASAQTIEMLANSIENSLKTHGRVIFPGGWAGSPGHAMLYEFRQKPNGDLIFLVWNTGSGIQNHCKTETKAGMHYAPVKAYRIPNSYKIEQSLGSYIGALITPNIMPLISNHVNYDSNSIYQDVIPMIAHLDGEEIEGTDEYRHKGLPQISGTCAWKVIERLCENELLDDIDNDLVHHALLKDSLECFTSNYIRNIGEKECLGDMGYFGEQLKYAIQGFSLHLSKLIKRQVLDQTEEIESLELIERLKNTKIRTHEFARCRTKHTSAIFYIKINSQQQIEYSERHRFPSTENLKTKRTAVRDTSADDFLCPSIINKIPKSPQGLISIIQALIAIEITDENAISVIQAYHAVYLNMPLTTNFLEGCDKSTLCELAREIKELNSKFTNSCRKHLSSWEASHTIAAYSGIAMVECILNEYYKKDRAILQSIYADPRNISTIEKRENGYSNCDRHYLFNALSQSHLFHVSDNRHAEKLQNIFDVFKRNQSGESDCTQHFAILTGKKYPEIQNDRQLTRPDKKVSNASVLVAANLIASGKSGTNVYGQASREISLYGNYLSLIEISANQFSLAPKSAPGKFPQINEIYTGSELTLIGFKNAYSKCYISDIEHKRYQEAGIKNTRLSTALQINHKMTANDLQLKHYEKAITAETDTIRNLLHIADQNNCIIVSTTEYIKSNISTLHDKDVQTILFYFLNKQGLIGNEIKGCPESIEVLLDTIANAIKFHELENGSIRKHIAFYYKLNVFIEKYIASMDQESRMSSAIQRLLNKCKKYHEDIEKTINLFEGISDSEEFLHELYAIKILALSNKLKIVGGLTKNEAKSFIETQILYLNKKDSFPLLAIDHEISVARIALSKEATHRVTSLDKKSIKTLLLKLKLKSRLKFTVDFPEIETNKYKINVFSGAICHRYRPSIKLPNNLTGSSIFSDYFNEKLHFGFLVKDKEYILRANNHKYYIKSTSDAPNIYWKTKVSNLTNRWFMAIDKSDFYRENKNIPMIVLSKNIEVWKDDEGNYILCERYTRKIQYYYLAKKQKLFQITDSHTQYVYPSSVLEIGSSLSIFTNFEDKDFIKVTQPVDNKTIKISLERYNLHFTQKIINGNSYFVLDSKPDYCLAKPFDSVNNILNSGLLIGKLPKDDAVIEDLQLLVPNQEYIVDKHKRILLDKELLVTQAKIDIANKSEGSISYINSNICHKKSPTSDTVFKEDCSNRESYFSCPIQNEQLVPNNALDAFRIAYHLLANRCYDKSFELLDSFSTSFTGKESEVKILLKIIAELPSLAYNKQLSISKQNMSPIAMAVKMKALFILVEYQKSGYTFDGIFKKPIENDSNAFARAQNLERNTSLIFLKSLPFYTEIVLNVYFEFKSNIPKSLRIRTVDLLTLLKFNNKFEAGFSNNVRKRILKLKTLSKRLTNQQTTEQAGKQTSLQQRIDALKLKITKSYHFVPSDTTPIDITIDLAETQSKEVKVINENAKPSLTINTLTFTTDPNDIRKLFRKLFEEAISDPAAMNTLHDYLDGKLKSMLPRFHAVLISELKNKEDELDCIRESHSIYRVLKAMISNVSETKKIIVSFDACRSGNKVYISRDSLEPSDSKYFDKFEINDAFIYKYLLHSAPYDTRIPRASKDPQKGFAIQSSCPEQIPFIEYQHSSLNTELSIQHIIRGLNLNKLYSASNQNPHPETSRVFTMPDDSQSNFLLKLVEETNDDTKVGAMKNQEARDKHKLTVSALNNSTVLSKMQLETLAQLSAHDKGFKDLANEIVSLLNSVPKISPHYQKSSETAKTARVFTLEDAYSFFIERDIACLKKRTGLSDAAIKRFYQITEQYLLEGTQRQQLDRVIDTLQKLSSLNPTSDNYKAYICKLGDILTQVRCYDHKTQPVILLFEFLDNKLIYPAQYSILEKLLSKHENSHQLKSLVVQLIMGGGKSKVISPLLAKLRANGTNLSLIEVPSALLHTNYTDMLQSSKKLRQKPFLLNYNRDLNCDAQYFYNMRSRLKAVITHKDYVITTRETIQSLEIKYIELLTTPISDLIEWENQISYLDDIINILKNNGDAIIDEVDTNLKSKDQLIYTVGSSQSLSSHAIQSLTDLYQFFEHVNLKQNNKMLNLYDIVTSKQLKPKKDVIPKLIDVLHLGLLESSNSPLRKIIAKISTTDTDALKLYLMNRSQLLPPFMTTLSHEERVQLALTKEHLTHILPVTLDRELHVNFGLARDINKPPIERELAIPYIANDTPNEFSRFQNPVLTMNYTIRAHLAKPLSLYVFKTLINDLYKAFKVESELNAYAPDHKKSFTVRECFVSLFENSIDPANLDINDESEIGQLYNKHRNTKIIKHYCLNHVILPNITVTSQSIASNSQNHVDSYNSVVGFTGTDYNYRCFHSSINIDRTQSIGTDGQTIDHLLHQERHDKMPSIHLLKKSLFDLIANRKRPNHLRAIIDAGAEFKGISNRKVAEQLSALFANQKDSPLKYVLYFDTDNVLCALKVCTTPENEPPVILHSSEGIQDKLNIDPSQYFSYYDQYHTTGTDIKQADHTTALVTVSDNLILRDLLQSVMRLRDLKGSHRVELVVMPSLAENQNNGDWDFKKILNFCLKNQAEALMPEHLNASFHKIHNLVRSAMLDKIRNSKSVMGKIILADAFTHFLYNFEEMDLFEKYGMPESQIETQILLESYRDSMLEQWERAYTYVNLSPNIAERQSLIDNMNELITKAIPICAPTQRSPIRADPDNQCITQAEAQQENENENENEQESQIQEANHRSATYKSWSSINLHKLNPGYSSLWGLQFKSMESLALKHKRSRTWQFDNNIFVSENFYRTCSTQFRDKINNYKKPNYFCLNIYENSNLKVVLITHQEANELRDRIVAFQSPNRTLWIQTPSGVPFAGKIPPSFQTETLHPTYEQILYFNGDTNILAGIINDLTWLKAESQNKLDYLNSELLTLHPSKRASFDSLSSRLLDSEKTKSTTLSSLHSKLFNSWKRLYIAYFYAKPWINIPAHTKDEFTHLKNHVAHRNKLHGRKPMKRQHILEYYALYLAYNIVMYFSILYTKLNLTLLIKRAKSTLNRFYMPFMFICLTKYFCVMLQMPSLSLASYYAVAIIAPYMIYRTYAYYSSSYHTIKNINNIANENELASLKAGAKSQSKIEYIKSYAKPCTYLYPRAYAAGAEIAAHNEKSILRDTIDRAKVKKTI